MNFFKCLKFCLTENWCLCLNLNLAGEKIYSRLRLFAILCLCVLGVGCTFHSNQLDYLLTLIQKDRPQVAQELFWWRLEAGGERWMVFPVEVNGRTAFIDGTTLIALVDNDRFLMYSSPLTGEKVRFDYKATEAAHESVEGPEGAVDGLGELPSRSYKIGLQKARLNGSYHQIANSDVCVSVLGNNQGLRLEVRCWSDGQYQTFGVTEYDSRGSLEHLSLKIFDRAFDLRRSNDLVKFDATGQRLPKQPRLPSDKSIYE